MHPWNEFLFSDNSFENASFEPLNLPADDTNEVSAGRFVIWPIIAASSEVGGVPGRSQVV